MTRIRPIVIRKSEGGWGGGGGGAGVSISNSYLANKWLGALLNMHLLTQIQECQLFQTLRYLGTKPLAVEKRKRFAI